MDDETSNTTIKYIVQCKFPQYSEWTKLSFGFEDEYEAVEFLNGMLTIDGYDGCTFRVLKTIHTESVITEKVRE